MSVNDYPYNDDLLKGSEDLAHARRVYGPIAFALNFPALLEQVLKADAAADAAKHRVRRRGLGSVAMVTVALIAASAAPIYHNYHPWSDFVVLLAAILGVLGSLIGLGLFSASHKAEWLQNRLVTESLRQFHFRHLLILAPEILDASASGDPLNFDANPTAEFMAFDEKRRCALDDMIQNLIIRKAEELEEIVRPDSDRLAAEIDPMPEVQVFARPHGSMLLDAYGRLRILRQRQYADHKLMNKGGLFSPFPRVQAAILSTVGFGCVFLLLVLHVVSAAMSISEQGHQVVIVLDYFAIWTALIALALRTIEEGLKPYAEVERYSHYQALTRRILERFGSSDTAGKLSAARSMEHAAYDEMAIFLRSHHEGRFSM